MAVSSNKRRIVFRLLRWTVRLLLLACVLYLAVGLLPQEVPKGWLQQDDIPTIPLVLRPTDRILVLAPHPDDDVLACAGVIQKALALGLPVQVAYMTNGDGNEWSFVTYSHHVPLTREALVKMGDTRHAEAIAGQQILGVPADHLTFLGYPDIGCMPIFTQHWRSSKPYTALLTRANAVPYSYALHPGAPYKGESILEDVGKVIESFQPTQIFVSHPADRNHDHRALYLYTRVALWHSTSTARLHPFLVHTPGWPHPQGLRTDVELPPPPPFRDRIQWEVEPLDRHEVSTKESALGAHQTQMSYSANYLQSFVRRDELFGDLPTVDLAESDAALCAEPAGVAGREWRFARLKDGRLELSMVYARPIARNTRALVYIFGDRSDRPFAAMPKISVHVDPFGVAVYDQEKIQADVQVERTARRATIRVPLSLLGSPQHVLVCAESFLGETRLDYGWWSAMEVHP